MKSRISRMQGWASKTYFMKMIWKVFLGLMIIVNLLSCKDDDPVTPSDPNVSVKFEGDITLTENSGEKEIIISFSKAAHRDGNIKITVVTDAASAFHTAPAASNGVFELPVMKGDASASFSLTPTDNSIVEAPRIVEFEIKDVSDGFAIGNKQSLIVTIVDDKLLNNKAKSYETLGGGWRSKKTYVYGESGRIAKVLWETETPALRTGTDAYFYATNGLIEKITTHPGHEEIFIQQNGRIIRSEKFEYGVKKSYNLYDYDEAGNVGAQANFHLQNDGSFKQAFTFIYLYFDDGNIYKQLTYIPAENGGDGELISTRTYDDYSDKVNPFPTFEVIPGIAGQPNLPGSYRLEENGSNLSYIFTYNYREDGQPTQRNTAGPGSPEVTTYQYY